MCDLRIDIAWDAIDGQEGCVARAFRDNEEIGRGECIDEGFDWMEIYRQRGCIPQRVMVEEAVKNVFDRWQCGS